MSPPGRYRVRPPLREVKSYLAKMCRYQCSRGEGGSCVRFTTPHARRRSRFRRSYGSGGKSVWLESPPEPNRIPGRPVGLGDKDNSRSRCRSNCLEPTRIRGKAVEAHPGDRSLLDLARECWLELSHYSAASCHSARADVAEARYWCTTSPCTSWWRNVIVGLF